MVDAPVLVREGLLVDPKVLLIESDAATAHAVMNGLEGGGIEVIWARHGASGLALKAKLAPNVVLVGLHLSDVNSIYLVGQLIDAHDCGVVVLSGAQSEAVRIDCLEVGADDYLPQGSTMRDMVARIRAVHRRVNVRGDASHLGAVDAALVVGPVQIDRRRRCVHTTDGQRLNLTSAEYGTLETLAQAAGGAVSRDRLSEAVLRRPWRAEDRSVDQLVLSLRQKLPTDVDGKHLIQSIRGSGYWLRAPNRPTLPFMKASSG